MWFKERLVNLGPLVLQHDITADDAADQIADAVVRDASFVREVVRDFVARKLTAWLNTHRVGSPLADDGQDKLFPDLPERLETSPGRFADQSVMNRRDWKNAPTQAKTKAANAAGFADGVEAAHDAVVPLLVDDEMTTADVWPPQSQLQLTGTR